MLGIGRAGKLHVLGAANRPHDLPAHLAAGAAYDDADLQADRLLKKPLLVQKETVGCRKPTARATAQAVVSATYEQA